MGTVRYSRRGNGRPWSPVDDEFIRANWATRSLSDIAEILDREIANTSRRAKLLGMPAKARPWSRDEDAIIRQHYGRATRSWLAARIGRSARACTERAKRLGLLNRRGE